MEPIAGIFILLSAVAAILAICIQCGWAPRHFKAWRAVIVGVFITAAALVSIASIFGDMTKLWPLAWLFR